MNKNLFRIIFNKHRGQLIAVAETSSTQGKGAQGEVFDPSLSQKSDGAAVTLGAISFVVLCALGSVLWLLPTPHVHAQVVAYRNAPGYQQPTVLRAANGVPQVNIQTPSAAGVSRNLYSQFDVQNNGVILNNSRTNVQTQQGGWVQGNPWLATGSARVILNEVNSSNPSQLNGYVEVAGQRAEVVIANPSGISVNGGGFINTSKATLTTGNPVVNGGGLDGYRVQGGNISINGNGLDFRATDYAAILARAVQVNAGIWANELKVVTGANQIDTASLATNTTPVTTVIAGTGAVPSFALDVAQIGGMYAGKVHLIGTEQGLGVRNTGTIGSTGGDLVLQNNGWLTTTGTLQASANLQIATQGNISNSGTLMAQGNTSITANSLSSATASVVGAGIKTDGSLISNPSASVGNLSIATTQGLAANGQNLAAGNISLTGVSVDLSGSKTNATNVAITTAGNLSMAQATVVAGQNLNIDSADLNNTGGTLAAGQVANLQTAALNNDGGLIQTGGNLTINTHGQTLINTNAANYTSSNAALNGKGGIAAQGTSTFITGDLSNDAGYIGSKGALTADSANISNTLSKSNPDLGIEGSSVAISAANLGNDRGAIRAATNLSVTIAGAVNNNEGLMSAGNTLTLLDSQAASSRTLAISNSAGTLIADNTLTVAASSLGGNGKVLSKNGRSITLNTDFSNSGQVIANGNANINSSGSMTNSGKLQAGNTLKLAANNIDNTAAGEISANTTQVKANSTLTNRGLIKGVDTQINAGTVNNIGTGRIYGDHLSIAAVNLTNDTETLAGVTKAGALAARERLDLGISGSLTNREHALIYTVGDMAIGGALDSTTRQATGSANTVNNNSATIEAGSSLSLAALQINNTNEHFRTRVDTLPVQTISEYQGSGASSRYTPGTSGVRIYNDESDHLATPEGNYENWSAYNYTRTITETRVDHTDPGQILSGGAMNLSGGTLTNNKSRIIAGGTLTATLVTLNNTEVNGERTLTDVGSVTSFWRNRRSGRDSTGSSSAGYSPVVVIQTLTLTPTQFLQNTASTGSGTQMGMHTQATVLSSTSSVGTTNARNGAVSSTTLPTSSLYKTNPASTANFLVETDSRFTNNKVWLSSDFMTQSLSLDPNVTQKRLGDGFYEQKLIREQVAQLTGRRFLGDYTSDEQEYQALMNSAITYGQQYNLRPGIALTAQQIAQLTSDIVWLVEQTITLPDGSQQKALVPQVYVKVQPGDLDGSGALLSGKDVNLNLSGDLTNSGTIAGRNVVSLTAENVNNLGGRIGGNDVSVAALLDLNNIGGSISAVNSLSATAGRDLNIQTTTQSASNVQSTRTGIDRVAGLYVSGTNGGIGGTLVASAGRDLNNVAGVVNNAGTSATSLAAGNNLNLSSVKIEQSNNIVWDAQNFRKQSNTQDVGSSVQGGGNVTLQAGQTLQATAANVQAAGALNVNAKDIQLQAGLATQNLDEAHQHTSKGFLSKSTVTTRETSSSTTALASNFGGATVNINAGNDIAIKGSNVVSDNATTLTAGNSITIEADQNTSSSSSFRQETKSGLMSGGGLSISYGTQKQSTDGKDATTTAAASTVGSVGGNVAINAGEQYKQVGSDVVALGGDIAITAKTVDIVEARETNKQSSEQKFEQSGLTLAVTSTVLSTVQNAQKQLDAASQTKDSRMKILAGASAAANLKMAGDALKAGQGDENGMVKTGNTNADGTPELAQANAADKAGGIQVSLSYGRSSSQSTQTAQSDTARGSTVTAGGNVTIAAKGGGEQSNLTVQGSDVSGQVVALEADHQVAFLAASNTSTQTSSNKSSSASVGVAAQLGNGGGGIGITGSASLGKGSGNGSETTYTNTHVAGVDSVSIKSGGDTTLKGATVTGNSVKADVGGNLKVESLQDTDTYSEKNQQVGGSVMVGLSDKGPVSGNVNVALSKINSNYASVTEQSGLKAGDGGFQVDVKGDTDLKGGAITSTDKAVNEGQNTFTTGGTLTTSDIQNKADYKATSVSVSVGAGGSPMPGQGLSSVLSGAGLGQDSGSASSTTTAGISGIAGDTAKRTGNKQQGINQIFNKDQVKAEVTAQVTITQEFGKQASAAVGNYAETKFKEAQANKDQAGIEAWKEGGVNRVALHTAIGGLTFGAQGAVGAATSQAAIDQIGQAIKDTNLPTALKQTLVAAAGTAIGAATGGTAGAASGFNATVNNYLKHTELQSKQQQLAACKDDGCRKQINSAWDKVSQERNAKTGDGIAKSSVNDNLTTMNQLASDMSGLAQYKSSLEDQLRSTSDPTQKASLQLQVNEADSSMRQIASQGKDALALLYQQTGDAKYQNAFQALSAATSGNELGAALAIPGGSGSNVNKAVQETKSGAQLAQTAKINALADEAQAANTTLNKTNSASADSNYVAPTHTSKDNFQTHGLTTDQVPATIKNQMTKDLEATFGAGAKDKAIELIESGRSVPVPMQATSDTKLYKLMANDDPRTPSSTTPYFVDAAQLQRLQKNPALANDILGLPPSSQAPIFKVYEVQPQPNTTPTVYQSDVATSTNKAGSAVVGNAKQTLVPDRSQWTEPRLTNIKIGGQ